ncbi:MAG: hypothetical protein ACTHQM_25595 [Thermoanaerobaculia bacterium]
MKERDNVTPFPTAQPISNHNNSLPEPDPTPFTTPLLAPPTVVGTQLSVPLAKTTASFASMMLIGLFGTMPTFPAVKEILDELLNSDPRREIPLTLSLALPR